MTLDILTTPEAAAYTRMSKPTLERWRLTGDGPRRSGRLAGVQADSFNQRGGVNHGPQIRNPHR